MNIRKWVVGAIIVGSLLFPVAVSACTTSWILWRNAYNARGWTPEESWETQALCEARIRMRDGIDLRATGGNFAYRCLPDTVDPRPRR